MKSFQLILFCSCLFLNVRNAEGIQCSRQLISEVTAVGQARTHAVEEGYFANGEVAPAMFKQDINRDGIEDLFVSFECGNHSCGFFVFLGYNDGKFCPIDGEISLTAGLAKRIISIEDNGDLVVFTGAMGAESGIVARYRIEQGTITEIGNRSFGGETEDFRTYEQAVTAVEQLRGAHGSPAGSRSSR